MLSYLDENNWEKWELWEKNKNWKVISMFDRIRTIIPQMVWRKSIYFFCYKTWENILIIDDLLGHGDKFVIRMKTVSNVKSLYTD